MLLEAGGAGEESNEGVGGTTPSRTSAAGSFRPPAPSTDARRGRVPLEHKHFSLAHGDREHRNIIFLRKPLMGPWDARDEKFQFMRRLEKQQITNSVWPT